MQLLDGLSRSDFLKQHWQKKPLLIKQAFPDFTSPISPNELAGLACEEGIDSRLVIEHGKDGPWQVLHGPFTENDFSTLPETHWSLLVQAVDHHLPEVSQLLDEFDFIPNWRIDDVMISYAPLHGSVGPHLDNYDVFLLQAQGQRHWHINELDYTDDDFIEGLDLQILKDFESQQDWILEPGDMLYLPPGVAHHGVACDDCLTYSVGFRAPSQKELLSAFTVNFNDVANDIFYSDPDLQLQESPGEIKHEHLQSLQKIIHSTLSNETEFASWFGRFITDNHNDYELEQKVLEKDDFHIQLKQENYLNRFGNIRFSYIEDDEKIKFFFAGNELEVSISDLPLIRYISSQHRIDYQTLITISNEKSVIDLLFKLHQEGCFFFDE